MAVTGAGAGLLNADSQKNVVACVTPQRSGMASGLSATMRFTAITVALGVYGALLGTGTRNALLASLGAAAPELATHAAAMASRMVAGDLPAALAQLPASSQRMAVPLLHQAFTAGFSILLASAGVLALLAAVLVGLLMRRPLPPRG